MGSPEDQFEDELEKAFWEFDALHKAHYRDADVSLPGPMGERDAFKRVLRKALEGGR